jgi:hypothetical protein
VFVRTRVQNFSSGMAISSKNKEDFEFFFETLKINKKADGH